MPQMSGLELAYIARECDPSIEIIVLPAITQQR